MKQASVLAHSLLTDTDIELFNTGNHCCLYEKLGSHLTALNQTTGTYFAVYAPSASSVEVIGDFNGWNGSQHPLNVRWDHSGIWEGFIPGVNKGALYKYRIYSNLDDKVREKADPFARYSECAPKTASIVWGDDYQWEDQQWLKQRPKNNGLNSPISIYELHIGSWKKQHQSQYSLSYRQLADELVAYIKVMNFTHVEFLPVMEHPFYPSWGYLCTGYFAPSSRYGEPDEFKYLVDALHRAGIGVYLDWVPAHFPDDEHALADFDGSCLFEHPNREKGFHPDWNSAIFNFERPQIVSFLLSSAHFWCDYYHADGLRVDAVASMIYLDYSRQDDQWTPNEFGGNEYLAAIDLLKKMNVSLYQAFPDIQMIAEESTAFPGVTRPVDSGGLGFGMKWMMGWMNDSLSYFQRDPIHRSHHQGELTNSINYVFSENFLLPLSHDEVVHGKQSLLAKMPGDEWQKFANLRLLYLYMYTHPGQKLLFMGDEFGQPEEWSVNDPLNWDCLDDPRYLGIQELVKNLNGVYRQYPALYANNFEASGWQWIDGSDNANSVISYLRAAEDSLLLVVLNLTPQPHQSYLVGVPENARYELVINSDSALFAGSGYCDLPFYEAEPMPFHGQPYSIAINLPPLAGLIFQPVKK